VILNNEPQNVDAPANKALLVVQTADGIATFGWYVDCVGE
jgi:hypothetical protein